MDRSRTTGRRSSGGSSRPFRRDAWSTIRSAAVLEASSVIRRTMRESRGHAGAPPSSSRPATDVAAAASRPAPTPQVGRLQAELREGPHERAVEGARLLLELTEPDSLDAARSWAFGISEATPQAELALQEAWEHFRHDRHRALN